MRQQYPQTGLSPLHARQISWALLCQIIPDTWEARRPCTLSRSATVWRYGDRVLTVGLSPRWVTIEAAGVGDVVVSLEAMGWEVR